MAKRKLQKRSSHRQAMFRNMAASLFREGRIETTLPKAKELRSYAEKLITAAKTNDLASRRRVMSKIKDKEVVTKLFDEIAPQYSERPGGYTRILKMYPRRGDAAKQAIIELVE